MGYNYKSTVSNKSGKQLENNQTFSLLVMTEELYTTHTLCHSIGIDEDVNGK
jgi:hypothetical protein